MKTIFSILFLLGLSHFSFGTGDETVDSLRAYLERAESQEEVFDYLMLIGVDYSATRPDSAIHYFEQAKRVAVELADMDRLSTAFYRLAQTNKSIGSYQIAKEYGLQSLRWAEENGNQVYVVRASRSLASIHALLYEYDRSKSYYRRTISGATPLDDLKSLGYAHLGLGNIYYYQDSIELAKSHFETSMQFLREINDQIGLAGIYVSLGNIARTEKDYSRSISNYQESLKIYNSLQLDLSMALVYYNLGDVYLLEKNFPKAEESYLASLRSGEKTGSLEDIKYAYKGLSRLHETSGNYKDALYYTNLYHDLKDSLANAEMEARVADLQAQRESDRKSEELAETRQRLSDADEQHASDRVALWVSIFAGVIVLIAALLFYSNLRRSKFKNLKLKLQSQHIQEKNRIIDAQLKDKDVLLKEVHHRVKNNLQMISSLLNLQSQSLKNESAVAALRESKDRVQAIALIHKGLYQNDRFAEINIKEYIEDLINYQRNLHAGVGEEVNFETDIEDTVINLDTAVPLGLIVSELMSNSLKHAFDESTRAPKIKVEIKPTKDLWLHMVYSDNGIGMPMNGENTNSDSLGLEIVNSLVEQLDGKMELNISNGTHFHVDFMQQKV